MHKLYGVALLSALLLSGCGESTAKEVKEAPLAQETAAPKVPEAKVMQKREKNVEKKLDTPKVSNVVKKETKAAETRVKPVPAEVSRFYTIFKDSAKIAPDGKAMLLVFGRDGDPYTDKLKADILSDTALAEKIQADVTPIYIDAVGQQMHKFLHNGEIMDVDTKTLVSIYNVDATPTLIFTDKEAGHIFIVPGYMPPKQFKATLDFVKEGVWKGKDRKNGDVYKALKAYYQAHGVAIKGAKK